ncbi:hypothetical protein HYT95_00430 [Candidatus Peregrinibacteria bacterium]|nr:hypothetical protein [Candidatus Peregrinibacteria bacterium]
MHIKRSFSFFKEEKDMWSPGWKSVECRACGKKYVCMPNADYYNSTGPTDGVCEKCLLREAGIDEIVDVRDKPASPFSDN